MRDELVRAASYDWSKVDPMVFGSMFQDVKPREVRRELGAHYTSEANILKVLRPLFLDAIEERVLAAWDDRRALYSIQTSLSQSHYLDPACGSGNFLIVAYRELRRIEHRIVARLSAITGSVRPRSVIKLSQFHGIEIDQWPARIAWTAIILVQQQMDRELEDLLGIKVQSHFPLKEQAFILGGTNALRVDWGNLLPASAPMAFIMGNPPFVGGKRRTKEQLADSVFVWGKHAKYGQLDFVANWFLLAARLMHRRPSVRAAFVSTNSITQGIQVPTIWGAVAALGSDIDFAHDSFKWSNGADNDAAVTVTAIGISPTAKPQLRPVWRYSDGIHADLSLQSRINGTLADLPGVYPVPRSAPLSGLGLSAIGSQPNDGGNWSKLTPDVAAAIRKTDPVLAKYLVLVVGSDELLKGKERWGIDSPSITPADARSSVEVRRRAAAVTSSRKKSTESRTVALGETPLLWQWYYHRATPKLLVPQIASENYRYLPVAFADATTLVTNALFFIDYPSLIDFAALSSRHLRVWLMNVGGGLEIRPRFASDLVWNTFPLPALNDAQRQRIENSAQSILDIRVKYGCPTPWRPKADGEDTLSDLYHRISMPADLVKAHRVLDDAVDDAFGLPHGLNSVELHGAMLDRYKGLVDAERGAAPFELVPEAG
jgi:N-6 DNA Methylase